MVQCGHALHHFCVDHPQEEALWRVGGEHLVALEAPSLEALSEARERLLWHNVPHGHFVEPDMGGELTALAVPECGARFVKKFPMIGGGKPRRSERRVFRHQDEPDAFDAWIRQNLKLLADLGSGYVAISATEGVKAFASNEDDFKRLLSEIAPEQRVELLMAHTDMYR